MSFIPESAWPESPIPESPTPEAAAAAPMTRRAKGRAARLARFEREQVIVGFLNRGVSTPEIAAKIGVGEKRMRAIVRDILFRRMPKAPEEFAAIQASRLNEALLVAFSAMTDLNLKAVDRVVRIVRELDRYHGFFPAAARVRETPAIEKADALPAPTALAFGAAAWVCRVEVGPQKPVACHPNASADNSLVLRSGAEGGASRRTLAGRSDPGTPPDDVLCPSFETPPPAAPQDEEARAGAARPGNASQGAERIESAPELGARSDIRPLALESGAEAGASRRACPEPVEGTFAAQTLAEATPAESDLGPSFETPPPAAPQDEEARAGASRPANASQGAENTQSAIGFPPPFRPARVRMTPNGIAAC